jgi:hypothetical protein
MQKKSISWLPQLFILLFIILQVLNKLNENCGRELMKSQLKDYFRKNKKSINV